MQQWFLHKAGANSTAVLPSGHTVQGQADASGPQADSYSALLAGLVQLSDPGAPQAMLPVLANTPLPEQVHTEQLDDELPAEAGNAAIMPQNPLAAELSAVSVLQRFTMHSDSAATALNQTTTGVAMAMLPATAASIPVTALPLSLPEVQLASGRADSVAIVPSAALTALTQQTQTQLLPGQLPGTGDVVAAAPVLAQPTVGQAALPLPDSLLQHFVSSDVATRPIAMMATAAMPELAGAIGSAGTNNATAVPETVFQWKAEQLGSQSSQWGQKLMHLLSDKINLQLGQQIQRAQIRLDPPQLGVIELTVSLDAERTSVQLYASNSQMRDAMQQNLEQLRQQLSQRLGQDQLLQLDVRDKPAQQQQPQQQQQRSVIAAQHADDAINPTTVPAAVTPLTTDRLNRLV